VCYNGARSIRVMDKNLASGRGFSRSRHLTASFSFTRQTLLATPVSMISLSSLTWVIYAEALERLCVSFEDVSCSKIISRSDSLGKCTGWAQYRRSGQWEHAQNWKWVEQEAQLPQRNSTSAAHMEGAKPSSPHPLRPLATPMHTVESETRKNVRQACRQ